MSELDSMPDGAYFGLPEDVYHDIPRLSGSGIKEICVSPLDFWSQSWMNNLRDAEDIEEEDSAAKKLGRAYHKLLLEGDEAFEKSFAVAPDKKDFPDALDGAEALKEACADLGLKKNGKIADLCERIREADPRIQLWPDIMADFHERLAGRQVLTKRQWHEIEKVRFVLKHMPSVRAGFSGGFPEVSLLWTENGVKLKSRADYLKPRGKYAAVIDIKTFGNVMQRPIDEIPATEIARNRYFIQPVTYTHGRQAMRALWAKHKMKMINVISGESPSEEWCASVMEAERTQFHFLFAQTGGVPNIIARGFAASVDYGVSIQSLEAWNRGLSEYRYGVSMFRQCMNKYGPDVPWIIDYGVRDLRDDEFPIYALNSNLPLQNDDAEDAA